MPLSINPSSRLSNRTASSAGRQATGLRYNPQRPVGVTRRPGQPDQRTRPQRFVNNPWGPNHSTIGITTTTTELTHTLMVDFGLDHTGAPNIPYHLIVNGVAYRVAERERMSVCYAPKVGGPMALTLANSEAGICLTHCNNRRLPL